jgi:hypothetical protein
MAQDVIQCEDLQTQWGKNSVPMTMGISVICSRRPCIMRKTLGSAGTDITQTGVRRNCYSTLVLSPPHLPRVTSSQYAMHYERQAMTWFRWLVAGVSWWRCGFDTKPVHAAVTKDKVAVTRFCFSEYFSSLLSVGFHQSPILIHSSITDNIYSLILTVSLNNTHLPMIKI